MRVFRVFESLTFYPCETGLAVAFVAQLRFGRAARSVDGVGVGAHAFVIITAVAVMERRRLPMLAAAWGAYLVLVLPMSAVMPKGRQVVAMRYAYEAMLPMLLLVGAAGVWVWRRSTPAVRGLLVGLLACELCAFAIGTRRLIPDWHDDETMRRATLAEFPDSEEANRVLATELLDQGRAGEALDYAQRASKLRRKCARRT